METDYKWRLEHLGTPRIMGETCSPTKGDSTKCHYLSHAVYSGVIPGLTWRLLLAQVATVQLAKDANAEITGGGKVVLTRLWKEKKSEIWNKCVSKQEKRRQRLTHFFFPFSASCVCTKALWNFGVCVLRASERWEPWLTGIFKKVRRTRRRHFRFQKWRGKCLWSHISATEEDYVICLLGYLVYFKDMYLGIKEEKKTNQNNVGTDPHELHEVLWKRMPRGTMSSR